MKSAPKFPIAIIALAFIALSVGCSKKPTPPPKASTYLLTTTFAGLGSAADTSAIGSGFSSPASVVVDAAGNIYVTDSGDNLIRKVTPQGVVSTLAGSGTRTYADGTGAAASFNNPLGLAIDAAGNLYVADSGNNMIRKVTQAGVVTTIAGTVTAGSQNGAASLALFNNPYSVAVSTGGVIYVGNTGNNQVRRIGVSGDVSTPGRDRQRRVCERYRRGGQVLNTPEGIAVDAKGNVYVADAGNNWIRKITPAGVASTFAGTGQPGRANGSLTAASFSTPTGLTFDSAGDMFITDGGNDEIRKITPDGTVSIVAGTGAAGFTNGIGTSASFNQPTGIAVDNSGNAYVADQGNNVVRRIILRK